MAKSKSFIGQHTALTVVILIVASFLVGFLLARAKYKPQINESYNMVMERENTISNLNAKLAEYEKAMIETAED